MAPEHPESQRPSEDERDEAALEGVFACELEGDRLVVSYANVAFCELLGFNESRATAGEALLGLVGEWLDDQARSELDQAVESGRQVWVRLDHTGPAGRGLRLMVKPASVPGAWVGSVRLVEPETSLSIRSAVLAEHGADGADTNAAREAPDEQAVGAEANPRDRARADVAADDAAPFGAASLETDSAPAADEELADLIPELTEEASVDFFDELMGAPDDEGEARPTAVAGAAWTQAGGARHEAALARALDAAGITWLEQDVATGALALAGRRLYEPATNAAERGRGLERLIHPADQERRRTALDALTAGRADEVYCAYRVREISGGWQWTLETGHLDTELPERGRYIATLQPVSDRESTEIGQELDDFSAPHATDLAERFHLPGALVEIHYSADGEIEFTFLAGRLADVDLAEARRTPDALLARIGPRDRAEIESRCAAAAAERTPWECGFGFSGARGERHWAHLRVEPVPGDGASTLFRGFILDDTERKRVEEALAESEGRFRQLYETAPFMMHSIDATGALVSVNSRWVTKLGYDRNEAIGGMAETVLAPDSKALTDVERLAAQEGEGFSHRECRLVTRDGRELECLASARIERDEEGRFVGAHFILIDVTDRNRAMQALKESEARFRAVVEDQTDAICRFDPQGRIRFANEACGRAVGTDADGLIGTSWFDLLDELQARAVRRELARLTPHQPLLQRELRMTQLDSRLFQWTLRAFFDDSDQLVEYQGVGRDMEELQRLEAQIREVSQREQRRIGHDLHDGLGQELTGVSLMLRKLELDAASEDARLGGRVASVRRMVNQCLATARSLARGLSPLELERGGLAGALEQLAATAEEMYGVAITVECASDAAVYDEEVGTELYRIAQEAMTNAVKHADPTFVAIRMLRQGERILLEIEDDGSGLPAPAEAGGGLGLKIMRYRANIIGASIEFMSEPGQGTLVRCQLQRPVRSGSGVRR